MPQWISDGTGNIGARRTYRAEAAIAANLCVKEGTDDGEVDVCGSTEHAIGVAPQAIAINEQGPVQRYGDVLCVASDAITRGAWLGTAAAGKVVAITPTAGDFILGRANEAAAEDGDLISVRLYLIETPA